MSETATNEPQTPTPPESDGFPDYAAFVADATERQAPPPPGVGVLVDKTV
jgi:hypothetical protein